MGGGELQHRTSPYYVIAFKYIVIEDDEFLYNKNCIIFQMC